jgi:hypothetical protein
MYHVLFAQIIHAERERELEAALRQRRLLRRPDETTEAREAVARPGNRPQALNPGIRSSGG